VKLTGGRPEALELSAKISEAWVRFARDGNPSHAGLPPWPSVSETKTPTMVFNTECALKDAPEGRGLAAIT
jgi:para-nitrobenzyl esterase